MVAGCGRALATLCQRAFRPISQGCTSEVRRRFLFPDARRRQEAFRHVVKGVVQPAVPFGGHAAGVVGAVVNDPTAIILALVIAIAPMILAHRSEAHTSELQSLIRHSSTVFIL